ncbi:putative transcriptional regulatory protein [Cladorrhinum sp. PSN332]|nr:putative transcriptional regulatory protein [Cladorrhinum sp. PSN332]
MKTAKPPAPESGGSSSRRAQPVRQTRINPPRNSSLNHGNSFTIAPPQEQPIDVFPGVTHFADAITALPKEIVRHFTLLKEVDAKIFQHEGKLFEKLRDALDTPPSTDTTSSLLHDASHCAIPGSAPMSVQTSSVGARPNPAPRSQLFHETGWKLQEMMVSLEEKNHVLLAANDALEKQMRRIDEIWPRLENEFSDEAKWGSTTHWAYVDNRQAQQQAKTNEKAERSRREAVATLSAAAQHLAEEAAARSNDRKQAIAAKKNNKTQATEADGDKGNEPAKKTHGAKSRKAAAAEPTAPVGLGITQGTPAAPAPAKRRKVETAKTSNGGTPAERAMSTVFGANTTKPKTTSPRETPVPESGPKKRKALPTSSGQAKKSRTTNAAMSPSIMSSPVIGTFPDVAKGSHGSPVPPAAAPPRPASSRARKNSTHNAESTPQRPPSEPAAKPNGTLQEVLEPSQQSNGVKVNAGPKAQKETPTPVPSKAELPKQETEIPPPVLEPPSNSNRRESTAKATAAAASTPTPAVEERGDSKKEATPLVIQPTPAASTVKTKSGRASKPSTPALATFAEANSTTTATVPPRSRPSRNNNNNSNNGDAASSSSSTTGATTTTATTTTTTTATKRSHKKGASISAAAAITAPAPVKEASVPASATTPVTTAITKSAQQQKDQEKLSQPQPPVLTSSQQEDAQNQDDEEEPDGDEPRYCKCNGVSYGEMVACDGEGCAREWFHLECVGLKVAPKGNAKWYCDECKERVGSRGGRR